MYNAVAANPTQSKVSHKRGQGYLEELFNDRAESTKIIAGIQQQQTGQDLLSSQRMESVNTLFDQASKGLVRKPDERWSQVN